jgi:trimeric autotransporter adhesin
MKKRNIIAVFSALVAFALLPIAQAAPAPNTPDPGGSLPVSDTADGLNSLLSISTGIHNSAFGFDALLLTSDTNFNTAVGSASLLLNIGSENTAVGTGALLSNSGGAPNTAVGAFALFNNIDGGANNAVGDRSLFSNVSSSFNNAHGREALLNSTGSENNAMGDLAMEFNTTGSQNTAVGDDALRNNVDGSGNVAVGDEAGTGLGASVNNCIAINVNGAGPFATLDNTCFIGSIFDQPVSDVGTQEAVFVDQFNVVGISASSRRFKHDIQPMDKASEAILALKPVTFKYNADINGRTQYGLVAEDVAQVNPDLVVQHKNGDISTVRYEQVNAMLLNEFLKEHKKVQNLETTVAQQAKGMEVLTAQLKEQAAQIQQVSAQIEVNKPAAKTVANK